jgi:plasmid maintenance system killer protein
LDILFSSERLENECNNERLLVRCHGKERAKKLRRRLDDLRAAPTLEVMRSLPGRCHELKGNRAAELALDPTARIASSSNPPMSRYHASPTADLTGPPLLP